MPSSIIAAFTAISSSGILTAVGAVMSAVSFFDQQSARDDQKAAKEAEAAAMRDRQAAERRQAEITNLNRRRQAVREARIKEANIINTGSQTSPGGSSVLAGAGGVQTQLGYNLGYYSSMDSNNQDIYRANTAAGDASVAGAIATANYQQAGAVGAIGKTIFDIGGGWKTVFGASGGTSGTAPSGTIFSGEPTTAEA